MDKPIGLNESGSAFWDAVMDPNLHLAPKPDEWLLLEQACRSLDLIDTLYEEFEKNPQYLTRGSAGQLVINPLIGHIDKVVARYQSLVKQLQIPDIDDDRAQQRAAMMSADMSALGKLSAKRRQAK